MVRGVLGIRIYKDVRRTGNSWTVFLQATFGPTTGEAISLRNKSYLSFCGGQLRDHRGVDAKDAFALLSLPLSTWAAAA